MSIWYSCSEIALKSMEDSEVHETNLPPRQNEVITWLQLPDPASRACNKSRLSHLRSKGPTKPLLHKGLPVKLERAGTQQKTGVDTATTTNRVEDILDILGFSKQQTLQAIREPSLDDCPAAFNPKPCKEDPQSRPSPNGQLSHSSELSRATPPLQGASINSAQSASGLTSNLRLKSHLSPSPNAENYLKGESSGSTVIVEAESGSMLQGKLLQSRKQLTHEGGICCCSRDIVSAPSNCQCRIV